MLAFKTAMLLLSAMLLLLGHCLGATVRGGARVAEPPPVEARAHDDAQTHPENLQVSTRQAL
jgi:hypothetical protein